MSQRIAFLFAVGILSLGSEAAAATTRYLSTSGSDSGDCSASPCATLVYAYSQSVSDDTISIAAGTYTESSTFDITHSITIAGAGASSTILQAATSAGVADHRFFKVIGSGVNATVSDLTMRYGVEASGGAINLASGSLTLENVTLSDNQVKDTSSQGINGGAISINGGSITLNNCTLTNNSVTTTDTLTTRGNGGAIFMGSGSVTLNNTTVSGNSALRGGGGLYSNGGTFNVNYSTIADNTSDSDGDTVGDGGGVNRNSGTLNLKSSIVAGNKKGAASTTDNDCSGALTSQGYNLTGSGTGCSLSSTGDATVTASSVFSSLLGPLSDNGGGTYTHALFPSSVAVDSIPSGTNDCGAGSFTADQRDYPRPYNGNCDKGATEADPLRSAPSPPSAPTAETAPSTPA